LLIFCMRMRNIRNDSATGMVGHPVTAQRRLLLDLIREAGGHIDAKEIYRRASTQDESISLATVYRSLHLFKELGLVEERRLGKVGCCYEIKRSAEHQHLLCKGCGRIIEFESPPIEKLVAEVQRTYGFDVTKAELYLEGYCQVCQGKKDG
jgi:Fur family ferric uptake transcriptional regulator